MATITTTKGPMDEADLEKRTGSYDNEAERVEWVEYWLNEELVHRSVTMELKKSLTGEGVTPPLV